MLHKKAYPYMYVLSAKADCLEIVDTMTGC